MRHLHHGPALEFAGVGNYPHLPGMSNCSLRDLHFAIVEVTHGTVGFDASHSHDHDVKAELADEVDRCFTHDRMVPGAHKAAAHVHFNLPVATKQLSNGHVVGDHAQATVSAQLMRYSTGGSAHGEHKRAIIRNARGN